MKLVFPVGMGLCLLSLAATARAQSATPLFEVPFSVPANDRNFNGGGLELSPDGQLLALGESDRAVHLREFPSGQELRALAPMKAVPRTLLFSPDGAQLAVHAFVPDEKGGIGGSQIALFEVKSGALLWQTDALLYVDEMAFWTKAGEFAVSGTPADKPLRGRTTLIFDGANGQEKRRLDFAPFALGGDGQTVLSMSGADAPQNPGDDTQPKKPLFKWDMSVKNEEKTRVGVESKGGFSLGGPQSGALSADGSRMIGVGIYNAKLFDAQTGDYLATFDQVPERTPFDFSRDGDFLLIPNAFGARLIDARWGDNLATLRFPSAPKELKLKFGAVSDLSDDGKTLVVAVPVSATRRAVYSYDLTARAAALQEVKPGLQQFGARGNTLALSPDGKILVAASDTLTFLRADTGERLRSPAGTDSAGSVVWSRDGSRILMGGRSYNAVQLWDSEQFKIERQLGQHEWPIEAVAVAPDGTLAAAGGSGFTGATRPATRGLVSLFETKSGATLKNLTAMTGRASAIAFSPDGKWLATGDDNGWLDIWDVAQMLASPDPDSAKPVAHLAAQGAMHGNITALQWSENGLWVVRRQGYVTVNQKMPVAGVGEGIVNQVSWRAGQARTLQSFGFASPQSQNATAFALSHDEKIFALAESGGYNAPGTLGVRDAKTGDKLASLPIDGQVSALAFAPDGTTIYLQINDNKGTGPLQKWTWK